VRKDLTKIEKLDAQFGGVAAKVKMWFDQGVTSQQVAQLLQEQYPISIRRETVARYRTRHWARERELRLEKQAQIEAEAAFAKLQEMRAAAGPDRQGVER
jgi:ribulose bisphosphate carboxylase small subunit